MTSSMISCACGKYFYDVISLSLHVRASRMLQHKIKLGYELQQTQLMIMLHILVDLNLIAGSLVSLDHRLFISILETDRSFFFTVNFF